MADTLHVRDVELSAAEHEFRMRAYPAAEPDGTVLVWLHGGAFMFGDLDMPEADETARQLARRGTTTGSPAAARTADRVSRFLRERAGGDVA